jgi:hypothetical protein
MDPEGVASCGVNAGADAAIPEPGGIVTITRHPQEPPMQSTGDASESATMPETDHIPRRSVWRPLVGLVTVGVVVYFSLMAAHVFGVALRMARADDTAGYTHRTYSYRNTVDAPVIDGFGLTFVGWGGVAWAGAMTLLILLGLAGAWSGRTALRRAGLVALLAVAGLWFANALYMSVAGDFAYFGLAALLHLAGLLGAILLCARRWRGM